MADDGERSHDPTPQRREKFRKDGRFARARDAAPLAASLGVLGVLYASREGLGNAARTLFARSLGDLGALGRGALVPSLELGGGALLALIGPPALAAAIGAIGVGMAQAGIHFDFGQMELKLERLDPLPRLRQLFFGKQGMIETVMSLLRVGVVGYVAFRAASMELPLLLRLGSARIDDAVEIIVAAIVHVTVHALVALGVIAAVDYGQSRFMLEREMKMTRQEIIDEQKMNDGDPKAKGRMRARARQNAKRRGMNQVKQASVVVTNPTHVAVALRYEESDPAPVVVAKGVDDAAMAIRAEARRLGIPILESRALARALEAQVPVGKPIGAAHFAAVAKILAFVYRLKRRRPADRTVRPRREG